MRVLFCTANKKLDTDLIKCGFGENFDLRTHRVAYLEEFLCHCCVFLNTNIQNEVKGKQNVSEICGNDCLYTCDVTSKSHEK